jgi:hypothetical protein
MASTLPDEGFPLPASTNDSPCSDSLPDERRREKCGSVNALVVKILELTLFLKQGLQFQYFRAGSLQFVLKKNLGPTFDVDICLHPFASELTINANHCIAYGIIVTGARLKTPVCWRIEGAKVVLYE